MSYCDDCLHREVCGEEDARDEAIMFCGYKLTEPKKGHWIRWYEQKENDGCIEHIPHCKCSECDKEYDPHSSQFIKYCSECGAKMIESQESEDKEQEPTYWHGKYSNDEQAYKAFAKEYINRSQESEG